MWISKLEGRETIITNEPYSSVDETIHYDKKNKWDEAIDKEVKVDELDIVWVHS